MKAIAPEAINRALGIFIPLIVVNCIILGRAEAFASSHGPMSSLMDALGVGLGYFFSLVLISFIREVVGAGTFWGYRLTPIALGEWEIIGEYAPANIMGMAPGAFILLGLLFGVFAWRTNRQRRAACLAAAPAIAQVARDFPKEPRPDARKNDQ